MQLQVLMQCRSYISTHFGSSWYPRDVTYDTCALRNARTAVPYICYYVECIAPSSMILFLAGPFSLTVRSAIGLLYKRRVCHAMRAESQSHATPKCSLNAPYLYTMTSPQST
jgi:hypothetical protein